jgi:glycosyltransferase involved in cell wall biosynthesis
VHASTPAPLRVALIADLLEEGWPSMDLVADMLMAHVAEDGIDRVLYRPSFDPIAPALVRRVAADGPMAQRILHRFFSYPRWLRHQQPADVYHIVDHSYAHLAHAIPPQRCVVTCHDTDAFSTLSGSGHRTSTLPAWFVRRAAAGLRRAAAVVCVSEATRADLVSKSLVAPERTLVVPNGVHPSCGPHAEYEADAAAARATVPAGGADLLHVGSTVPRKRIDTLLEILAQVASRKPDARLWRVGGPFTPEQSHRARELGLEDRIVVLPFVSRPVLAALYRRAAIVLLPSEREGFGLPLIEAMACGSAVVCSDLPVLREVAGEAAEYCPVGDAAAWTARILSLLDERDQRPGRWTARGASGVARAAAFSWTRHAAVMAGVYRSVAASRPVLVEASHAG